MSVLLSQPVESLDLGWVEGDTVDLSFTVRAVDWSGDYTAQIRKACSSTSTLIGKLDVTAVLVGADSVFTFSMSEVDSALVKHGKYYWDLQEVGGVTRLQGRVIVGCQVTVPA